MARKLITAEVVTAAFERGEKRISGAVVTPDAWSKAQELGVQIDRGGGGADAAVDASGVVVVRGQSVTLAHFAPAGVQKNVQLVDVITRQHGSPMAAGFMSFARADAFEWRLDYDEIDYVLEGVLHITIGGRVVEGKAGDVLYIPKGSAITFGTPTRTKVFYVTHPADWSQGVTK